MVKKNYIILLIIGQINDDIWCQFVIDGDGDVVMVDGYNEVTKSIPEDLPLSGILFTILKMFYVGNSEQYIYSLNTRKRRTNFSTESISSLLSKRLFMQFFFSSSNMLVQNSYELKVTLCSFSYWVIAFSVLPMSFCSLGC